MEHSSVTSGRAAAYAYVAMSSDGARITSQEIADELGMNATQVRRDLSQLLGRTGRRGVGYQPRQLAAQLAGAINGASGSAGVVLIAAERRRQIAEEGCTPEHDDEHRKHQLARAASCYLLASRSSMVLREGEAAPSLPPHGWPWDREWWKPSPGDPVRDLVKAGALIAAEIDRLARAA